MARGWESKDVESQQDLAEQAQQRKREEAVSPATRARNLQRESLELTRTRVLHDLGRASHPRHRLQLQAALTHLDEELRKLDAAGA